MCCCYILFMHSNGDIPTFFYPGGDTRNFNGISFSLFLEGTRKTLFSQMEEVSKFQGLNKFDGTKFGLCFLAGWVSGRDHFMRRLLGKNGCLIEF